MPSDYDATEFIDGDFQGRPSSHSLASAAPQLPRAPTREEVDSKVAETQQKLAELRRAQEELERERIALEETRRRQVEFQTGRQEVIQNLTRGVGLLAEAEFASRRDAEQMAKALVDLRDALSKVQAIREESWTQENFGVELTRGLTTLENARMEWNGARLKFDVLSAAPAPNENSAGAVHDSGPASIFNRGFGELCRLGFALTWPVALLLFLGLVLLILLQLRR
jgi:hypothetical protein